MQKKQQSQYANYRRLWAVLLSLPLLISLASCGTARIKPVRCDEPTLRGETWADVGIYALEVQQSIRTCNAKNGYAD